MRVLFVIAVSAFLFFSTEAKTKKKYDNDFVFGEEENVNKAVVGEDKREKRTWIYDSQSDLCMPLNCKKRELCLLESLYTAVCVSKKELHKNGDIIVSKLRYLAEEAKKKALEDMNDIQNDDEDDEDDDDSDGNDDIFYDTERSDNTNFKTDSVVEKCVPCPISKPVFLCGSDNRTYSSSCRLNYHNCIHGTDIKVACTGFCPCEPDKPKIEKQKKKVDIEDKRPKKLKKRKQTPDSASVGASQNEVYNLIPTDLKLDNKHYKYITYNVKDSIFKSPGYAHIDDEHRANEVNDEIESVPTKKTLKDECSPVALQAMGDRLVDWFSVIRASNKKKTVPYREKHEGSLFPSGCKSEVSWMFQHLDTDGDYLLSLMELYSLEHDENEHCIRPFLDNCDSDKDIFITPFEWCECFTKSERPCAAIRKRIPRDSKGAYVPRCDADGYYEKMQCHAITGMCWCVSKHGVELPNSRTHGKINCDLFPNSGLDDGVKQGFIEPSTSSTTTVKSINTIKSNDVTNDEYNDDEDDDDDDDIDGSGEKAMEL